MKNRRIKEKLQFSWPAIVLAVLLLLNIELLYLNSGNNLENTIKFLLNFSPTNIKEYVLGFGLFSPVVLGLMLIGQSLIAPIPGQILIFAAAMIYGPIWGTAIVIVSNFIGAILCFKISEHFGRPLLEKVMSGEDLDAVDRFMQEKKGFVTFLLIRLNPVMAFDIISYGAGLTKMSFKKYVIATAISVVIGSMIYTTMGYEIIEGNVIPLFVLSAILIALVILIPVLKEKFVK